MTSGTQIDGQNTVSNSLRQVEVRLKLIDGPPLYCGTNVHSPKDALNLMASLLKDLDREYFCVVNLDASGVPLNFNTVSIGDIASAMVPIQNVFKSAILSNASKVMCFHNHPSGDIEPSDQDITVTKRVAAIGNLMNIPVIDHIIIGGNTGCYYSFCEKDPDILKTKVKFEETERSLAAEPEKTYEHTQPKLRR